MSITGLEAKCIRTAGSIQLIVCNARGLVNAKRELLYCSLCVYHMSTWCHRLWPDLSASFPPNHICILQVIKDWRWEESGSKATSAAVWAKQTGMILTHNHELFICNIINNSIQLDDIRMDQQPLYLHLQQYCGHHMLILIICSCNQIIQLCLHEYLDCHLLQFT